jgi:hypothetical protein
MALVAAGIMAFPRPSVPALACHVRFQTANKASIQSKGGSFQWAALLPPSGRRSKRRLNGFFGTMSKIAPGSVLCTIFSLMLTDLLPLPLDDSFALIS